MLKITAQSIFDELTRRGIDVSIIHVTKAPVLAFEYNGELRKIIGANPDASSAAASSIAQNKQLTYEFASRYSDIPTPKSTIYDDLEGAIEFLKTSEHIVVKPTDGSHGNGVTTNITQIDMLEPAIKEALSYSESKKILLQEFIQGEDIRVLVIGGEYVCAVRRTPASVIGDGERTVMELMIQENADNPDRGSIPYTEKLNKIDIEAAKRYLSQDELAAIHDSGKVVKVVGTANIGTGGRAEECGDKVPEKMIQNAIAISEIAGTFICGVDFMYDEEREKWYLIEINASPSFGLHMTPSSGKPMKDLPTVYVDKLLAEYSRV